MKKIKSEIIIDFLKYIAMLLSLLLKKYIIESVMFTTRKNDDIGKNIHF
jgi:hypothetical protein